MHHVPAEWFTLDLYAELGVSRTATEEQLRAAYRDLAPRFHPDRHPGDELAEERFKRIAAAYKVLGDPLARASYDRLHLAGPRPVPVRPPPAHRVPVSRRHPGSVAPAARTEPAPSEAPARASRDEASTLAGLAVLVVAGAILIAAAVAIAVFVIGPDCDVPRELQRLGCPPAP